jgi:hypothetical protein
MLMRVVVQFPIADARLFGPSRNLRLPLPDFPEPVTEINPQFVHHFGEARERENEPDEAWPDELKFITANRAIKFDQLEKQSFGNTENRYKLQCQFRRLFNDGWVVVRTELGFKIEKEKSNKNKLTIDKVLNIAQQICQISTLTYGKDKRAIKSQLIRQGRSLARNYGLASVNKLVDESSSGLNLVEEGNPLLLVELTNEEADLFVSPEQKDGVVAVDTQNAHGANLFFCKLKVNRDCVSTWILQQGTASHHQFRSLRICLSRVHAEREVLDSVLRQIKRGKILGKNSEYTVNNLDEYFNKRIKIVDRKKWSGINQSEILSAINATQSVVRSATHQQLIDRYDGGRRQVFEKIKRYQEERNAHKISNIVNIEKGAIVVDKNVTVSGSGNIVNVADYLENVTNTVNNNLSEANVDEELKDLIRLLNLEIEKVSENIEPVVAKKLAKNLNNLSEEVASENPDKRWYELSLTGLKESAESLGNIASPIVDIVTKLTPLLS